MRSTVTAVLVATTGGTWLAETISGISEQHRRPDLVIAVNNGGSQQVKEQLLSADFQTPGRTIGLPTKLPFGRVISTVLEALPIESTAASRAADSSSTAREWLWLLSEDSCPEPAALAHILGAVERAHSVAVAGPKLVDWDHPERIIELGQGMTTTGERWLLRRQELDQQQHDHLQDVLAVGPAGMLVRRDVWEQLNGFDPAYPHYDDGLDFSVRARLAGYRVEVSPQSRVRFARSGIAGPHIDRSRKVLRIAHRQSRTAQLHRRIAYAPALIAALLWLCLPLWGALRVMWALIREQPGNMLGELAAALRVFCRPAKLLASRRRVKAASRLGWSAIRPLRTDLKTVRATRIIDRETILAARGKPPRDLNFFSTGAVAVLGATLLAGIALTWWAIPHTQLLGGAMAPLNSFAELWRNTHTIDGVAADPFAWVLALLGSITFWNPSHALVLFLVVAPPLAALGAWIWAAQLSESAAARATAAIGFALSPVLLGSIASGRITTLILAVVLPWLLLAATRCRQSWSWAGTASLLAAIALACAPVLIPVALVFLLVGIFSSLRGILRVLSVAIGPLVLFAPKIVATVFSEYPLEILRDPGITMPYTPGTSWHLLLGFPEHVLQNWEGIFAELGLGGVPATLLVGILLLPLALLTILGLFTGRISVTILHALLGGLGMVTAAAATRLFLTTHGDQAVAIWSGSGLLLYWLALLGLAAVGVDLLKKAAPAVATFALVALLVATGPVTLKLLSANVALAPAQTQVPALVQVTGEQHSGTRTLLVEPLAEQAVRATVLQGSLPRLDSVRTAADRVDPTRAERQLAELVGSLASLDSSSGGNDLGQALRENRINFVLLQIGTAQAADTSLQRTLDQHTELTAVGVTKQGLLWRVTDAVTSAAASGDDQAELAGTSLSSQTVWLGQIVLLFMLLLLALPTGEVVERPEKRRRQKKSQPPLPPAPAQPAQAEAQPAQAEAQPAQAEAQPAQEEAHD